MSTHQHIGGLPIAAIDLDAPPPPSAVARRRARGAMLSPAADVCAALAAAMVATLVTNGDAWDIAICVAMAVLFPIGMALTGRYRHAELALGVGRLADLPYALVIASVIAWGGRLAEGVAETPRVGPIATWWAVALGAFIVGRLALSPLRAVERVLVVGAGSTGRAIAASIGADRRYRADVRGFLDDLDRDEAGPPLLGGTDDIARVISAQRIDRVLFAFGTQADTHLIPLVRTCTAMGVQVDVVPRLFEVAAHRPVTSLVNGVPIESLPSARPSATALAVKRAMDIALASVAIVLLAPLALTVAAVIALTDRGPVLYSQPRVGRGGSTFRMLKFRTMHVGSDLVVRRAGAVDPDTLKLSDDPRITTVGRLLRRTSLDELPQLVNVLRGDMSLVGPRPLPLYEAVGIPAWAAARHELRPGLTGLWQVLGRSEIPFDERLRLDWIYVRQWSLGADLRLLGRTFGAVVSGRGAY